MKVVFVCTGNTCRSPMAEAMWRYLMKDVTDDSYTVHSAGLAPAIGMPAAEKSPILSAVTQACMRNAQARFGSIW